LTPQSFFPARSYNGSFFLHVYQCLQFLIYSAILSFFFADAHHDSSSSFAPLSFWLHLPKISSKDPYIFALFLGPV
jgi:hypothetical protein